MSERFTKGEWHTEKRTKGVIILAKSEDLNAGFSICAVNGPESEANSALIACAPEMYEMLKSIVEGPSVSINEINTLLAKARGES